jgi:heme-degrading monooxygenase HmoA
MYVRETRYNNVPEDKVQTTVDKIVELLPTVTRQVGFNDAFVFADRGTGTVTCVTLWETKSAMTATEPDAGHGIREAIDTVWRDRPVVSTYRVAHHHHHEHYDD